MKLLLIKVGKAIEVLKREGILRGGKRVFSAFFALFRFVGKGQILFVTGGVGDSARYRTEHVSEELALNGFKCSITVQDNPWLGSYADKFEIFVFHRVLHTPKVKKMIEKIKAAGKEIIFETDDLVYDAKYLEHMDYFKVMNSFEKKLYENGVGGEILADPYVKVCTTTTKFLADKLREHDKKVFIVPNRLSKKDVETAEKILNTRHSERSEESLKVINSDANTGSFAKAQDDKNSDVIRNNPQAIRIGYFSGALSHNKDFATVTDVLMLLMEKHENLELFLVGPLDIESKLQKFADRIKQFPYVTREKHFANVASVDINIAPLEIGNPFCESKSELKFFEAGIVGVPTVATATQPFFEAISDGEDGFVANDTEQWIEKLEKLISDKDLRISMGEKAREKALECYTTINAGNVEYYDYLKSKLKNL